MSGNSGSGGSGGSGGQPVASGPQACPVSDLRIGLGAPSGAAGSVYYAIEFTNTGSSACTLYGYPGVALAATDGGPAVGALAVRAPGAAKVLVTLAPGATAHAVLQVEQTASYPAPVCKPVRTQWLAVYPPAFRCGR